MSSNKATKTSGRGVKDKRKGTLLRGSYFYGPHGVPPLPPTCSISAQYSPLPFTLKSECTLPSSPSLPTKSTSSPFPHLYLSLKVSLSLQTYLQSQQTRDFSNSPYHMQQSSGYAPEALILLLLLSYRQKGRSAQRCARERLRISGASELSQRAGGAVTMTNLAKGRKLSHQGVLWCY